MRENVTWNLSCQGIYPHRMKLFVFRKPLRKEENGTSRGEYAMSIRNKKSIGTNNTVV